MKYYIERALLKDCEVVEANSFAQARSGSQFKINKPVLRVRLLKSTANDELKLYFLNKYNIALASNELKYIRKLLTE